MSKKTSGVTIAGLAGIAFSAAVGASGACVIPSYGDTKTSGGPNVYVGSSPARTA